MTPSSPIPFRLVLAVFLLHASLTAQSVRVDVDASRSLRPVNPWLYGINTARWDESLFPGATNDMLLSADRDAIAKIKASGITLLKYPGGNDADQYIWNATSNNPTEMDTDEYIALCREVGAEPFITVNFNEPPELAAAWVRYCNIEKGYRVKLWEVGDEQWGTWARGHVPPEEYAKKYIRFVAAMRAADPSIKVATNVPLGTHPENWAERVVKAAPDYIDMITYTYFPQQWGKEDDDSLMATVGKFHALAGKLREDVERAIGHEKAASILFVNVGYNSVNHSPGPQTIQMVNAVWTAAMLGTMAELGTDIACFWALHNFYPPRGGDFGYLSSEGSNTPRYDYYVFPLLAPRLRGTLLAARADDAAVSVFTSRYGKKVSSILINKDKHRARTIELRVTNFDFQPGARLQILDESNKPGHSQVIDGSSGAFSLKLPPYSVAALDIIARDSTIPADNLARLATATASSFSTIGPHFKPSSAIDGNLATRWNSAAWTKSNGDEAQWFQLAWKTPKIISSVSITWGETWGTVYQLKASSDGQTWKVLRDVTNGTGGTEKQVFAPMKVRFLRMEGQKGSKGISAYSIREFAVFER